MKNRFNHPITLHAWQVIAVILALALLTVSGAVVWAQGGDRRAPDSTAGMFKPGTIRLVGQQASIRWEITCDNNYHNVLYTVVKVPAGKRADLIATFNAEAEQVLGAGRWAYGRFRIGSQNLSPSADGGMWVVDGNGPKYLAFSQQGMTTTPVTAGTYTLYYDLRCTGGNLYIEDSILTAIVNIR
ncbi:MAG: hypothetical protein HY741_26575 [Chloroflexi bacterium]|nr:hypothetical protein [Chloroflexota bacterium]